MLLMRDGTYVRTGEYRATQLLICEKLSLAILGRQCCLGEEGGGGHRVEPGDTDRSISLERGGGGCQDAKDQQSPQDDRGSGFLIFSFG